MWLKTMFAEVGILESEATDLSRATLVELDAGSSGRTWSREHIRQYSRSNFALFLERNACVRAVGGVSGQ